MPCTVEAPWSPRINDEVKLDGIHGRVKQIYVEVELDNGTIRTIRTDAFTPQIKPVALHDTDNPAA